MNRKQARDCWTQLWKLCNARDEAFHLLLPGPGGGSVVQEWLKNGGSSERQTIPPKICNLVCFSLEV
jgi:hypothetical protein